MVGIVRMTSCECTLDCAAQYRCCGGAWLVSVRIGKSFLCSAAIYELYWLYKQARIEDYAFMG